MGILIWHYQHFFSLGKFEQPFENELPFLYHFGGIFVDLFFCLSGYIFFSYYQNKIATKEISFKNFIVYRLSRLYPLILITLIFTAIFNYLLFFLMGKFYIYTSNDLFSFFANLFFLQSGFFKLNPSFNAPSWSIGIEFWIYLLFFVLVFHFKKNLAIICGIISVFFFVAHNNNINFGLIIFSAEFERGLASFFLGGVVHFLIQEIKKSNTKNYDLIGFITLSIAALGYFFAHEKFSPIHAPYIDAIFSNDHLTFTMLLHPLLIFSLTLSPLLNKLFSIRILRFFGDISYSTYLWHVPIQLGLFLLILVGGVELHPASKKFFVGYFLLVIFISYLSSYFFERPLQNKIRAHFAK